MEQSSFRTDGHKHSAYNARVDEAWSSWEEPLRALCERVREATRVALVTGDEGLSRPAGVGAGDVTFGLDVPAEEAVEAWFLESAARGPLSLLTEDAGWRHRGPAGLLDGFDHGGPRIAIDPIDGTRNLMVGLRSAWTVISFAGPGAGEPRLGELSGGLVSELPTPLAAAFRAVSAGPGGACVLEERDAPTGALRTRGELHVDGDDRVDNGYFPVFRYKPDQRPAIARLEAALFGRLEAEEGADLRSVYDDQYISNAGQLFLLSTGTYRAVIDPRALVAERLGRPTVTSKPYDVAGAIFCARAAGAQITAADGAELDFAMDTETPVHFAGYVNPATRSRVEPHWLAALAAELPG